MNTIKIRYISMALLVVIILVLTIVIWSMNRTYKAKVALVEQESQETINSLEEKVLEKSDIEMLEFLYSEANYYAEWYLDNIDDWKQLIKEEEVRYEHEILSRECYGSQMDRKVNWLEYNIEYCLDKENLEQFRTKK